MMVYNEKPSHFHGDRPFYQTDWQYYYQNVIDLVEPGTAILDAGCGRGGMMESLQRQGCDVYGFDISPDAVHLCQQKGLNVWIDDLDNISEHTRNCKYDYVLVTATLEHITDPRGVLNTLQPICKYIIIAVPNFSNMLFRWYYLLGKNAKKYTIPGEASPFLGMQSDAHIQFFNQSTLDHLLSITGYTDMRWNSARFHYDGSNNHGITHKGIFRIIRGLIMNSLPPNSLFSSLLIVRAKSK